MLDREPKRKYARKSNIGVGFDQHYTDSTLQLLAPKSYLAHDKRVRTLRAIPKQEILVSLLLFGKAYLSRPTWLLDAKFPELEKLRNEDLIDWIPDDTYVSAFETLSWLLDKIQSLSWASIPNPLSLEMPLAHYNHLELEREIVLSELLHDINFVFNKLFYISPLLNGNVRHLGYRSSDPAMSLFNGADGLPMWPPFGLTKAEVDKAEEAFRVFESDYGSFLGWINDTKAVLGDRYKRKEFIAGREAAIVLDGAMSSIAAERFASSTSLPLKTSGRASPLPTPSTVIGDEAYQLLKVQFHDLRYPVIESVEDVLRLRDDRHLETYRAVIAEYSGRLRQELEDGRSQVIESFRSDIKVALQSLKAVDRWARVVDWSFYISLPLVVIGSLYGLPLSDILTIPLTSYAKFVAYHKRKELDWILFGRH